MQETHIALIDGPYGNSHNDFGSFDTVLLISGSTGTTFTLPILLDLAARAQKAKLPVKRVVFIWIVKNTSWTASELTSASESLRSAGIKLSIKIHVTCDDNFTTGEENESKECGCACDKSLGPCCCINVESDSDQTKDNVNEKGAAVNEKKDAIVQVQSRSNASFKGSLKSGKKSKILPCATFQSGRPDFYPLLWELLEQADGETGVAVCGPLGLSSDVRRTVVRCSDERAVHKGTGAQGIYLHAECFGW
jgi:ferric-chelate reductase